MSQAPDETVLAHLIADVARLYQNAFEKAAARSRLEMTPAEARVLCCVAASPGLKQSALAARMCVEPMTLSSYVDRLARRGLVERIPDPSDRRVKTLVPGDGSGDALAVACKMIAKLHERITGNLDQTDLEVLIRGLEGLRENLAAVLGQSPRAQIAQQPSSAPRLDRRVKQGAAEDVATPAPLVSSCMSDASGEYGEGAPDAEDATHTDCVSWRADAGGMVVDAVHWESYTGQDLDLAKGYGWLNMIYRDDRSSILGLWQRCVRMTSDYDAIFRVWHVGGATAGCGPRHRSSTRERRP